MNFENLISKLHAQMVQWGEGMVEMLPRFVLALLVMIAFYFAGKVVRSTLKRVLSQVSQNEAVNRIVAALAYFSMLALGLFISLGILELEQTVASLLAGAGVIGLAIGFAFQEIASNFIAGILIAFRKPYRLDDIIEIDDYLGTVEAIDMRTTTIRTFDGLAVFVPNKKMFTEVFTNLTDTPYRRVEVSVGVSYAEDLRRVSEVVKKALEGVTGLSKREPIEVFFQEFSDSSINFVAHFWIEYPGDKYFFRSRNDAIVLIKEAFDKNGILIPFPIRTLDFGIKGGQPLSKALLDSQKNHKET